jgi:hypothetical protein
MAFEDYSFIEEATSGTISVRHPDGSIEPLSEGPGFTPFGPTYNATYEIITADTLAITAQEAEYQYFGVYDFLSCATTVYGSYQELALIVAATGLPGLVINTIGAAITMTAAAALCAKAIAADRENDNSNPHRRGCGVSPLVHLSLLRHRGRLSMVPAVSWAIPRIQIDHRCAGRRQKGC